MFSNRLRIVREYRGYTVQDMADSLKMTLQSYQAYEKGDRQPDCAVLVRLADLLDVPLDFLLERDVYLQKLGILPGSFL